MRKIICLLMAMLLAVMPLSAGAEEDLQSVINGLPTVEEFQAMSQEEQLDAYNRTQYAYDAYMALSSAEEKAALEGAEEKFEELFSYFNTLVIPVENGETAEKESNSQFVWLVPAVLAAAFFAFGTRKKRT